MLDGKLELENMRNEAREKAEQKTETIKNEIPGKPKSKQHITTKGKPHKKGLAALQEIMHLPGVMLSPKAKKAYAKMKEKELKKKQQQKIEDKK